MFFIITNLKKTFNEETPVSRTMNATNDPFFPEQFKNIVANPAKILTFILWK